MFLRLLFSKAKMRGWFGLLYICYYHLPLVGEWGQPSINQSVEKNTSMVPQFIDLGFTHEKNMKDNNYSTKENGDS